MKNNKPHHQVLKEQQQVLAQHASHVKWLESMKGKMLLVLLPTHGIQSAYLTDIASEFPGTIALRFNQTKEGGDYFDVNQIRIYKVYDTDAEAALLKAQEDMRKAMAEQAQVTDQKEARSLRN